MRNLILFIVRFHAFFLFIFLELIAVSLITKNKQYHRSHIVNSSNAVSGKVLTMYNNIQDYLHLRRVNDSLLAEVGKYRSADMNSKVLDTVNTYCFEDSLYRQVYEYIPAKILSLSTNQFNNYLTLDRGKKHGVQKGMGVIGPSGVIGVVIDASNHFSRVMSVLHKDARVSSKIIRTNARGTIRWKTNDPHFADLEYVNQPADLRVGDTIMTDGSSTHYPEDIMVGTIKEFNLPSGSDFYQITVALSTPFNRLEYAYVVNYLYREEREQLEEPNQ